MQCRKKMEVQNMSKEKRLKMQNVASFIQHREKNHKAKLKGIPSYLQQTQRLFIILHVVLQIIIKF